MRDITPELRRAAEARRAWAAEDAGHVAEAIAGFGADRQVEWDYDAGEAWARCWTAGAPWPWCRPTRP